MNLQNWINQARAHWKEHRPKLYAELVLSGQLEAALQDAAEVTHREMSQVQDSGFSFQDAWEMLRENYLFPAEEGGT